MICRTHVLYSPAVTSSKAGHAPETSAPTIEMISLVFAYISSVRRMVIFERRYEVELPRKRRVFGEKPPLSVVSGVDSSGFNLAWGPKIFEFWGPFQTSW